MQSTEWNSYFGFLNIIYGNKIEAVNKRNTACVLTGVFYATKGIFVPGMPVFYDKRH